MPSLVMALCTGAAIEMPMMAKMSVMSMMMARDCIGDFGVVESVLDRWKCLASKGFYVFICQFIEPWHDDELTRTNAPSRLKCIRKTGGPGSGNDMESPLCPVGVVT
jgi:hypothetical protein